MFLFQCPHCQRQLQIPSKFAGKEGHCPNCQKSISIPPVPIPPLEAKKSVSQREAIHEDDDADMPLSKPSMKIDHEELIDMTAMVDIVFFLLIFFLVTSMSAVHSSMPTPTPESKGAGRSEQSVEQLQAEGDIVTVRIHRDDRVEIDGVTVADMSDLPWRLQKLRSANGPHTGMLVVAHGDATHGRAVLVLDAGYEAGMERVRLAVSDSESE